MRNVDSLGNHGWENEKTLAPLDAADSIRKLNRKYPSICRETPRGTGNRLN